MSSTPANPDIDALLLFATALSSKRRPAELIEIMGAADLVQESVPAAPILAEAFRSLSTRGLLLEVDDCFALTPDALVMIEALSKKLDHPKKVLALKAALAAYVPSGEHPAIELDAERFSTTLQAFRASGKGAGKNMLMPKPKVVEELKKKRPGPWQGKAATAAKRKR